MTDPVEVVIETVERWKNALEPTDPKDEAIIKEHERFIKLVRESFTVGSDEEM